MMFEFDTPTEQEIRQSVRKLAKERIPGFQLASHSEEFPIELFKDFAKLGLTGLSIGDQHGGTKSPPTTIALVMEEIAAVDLGPAIFLSVHLMVSALIEKFASDQLKQRYLPRLASGELLAAFALTESSAGSDAAALKTLAKPDGSKGYRLNGDKCWITSAGAADLYIVFARTDPQGGKRGISAFLVERDSEGLSFGPPEQKMGCELSPIATMQFDNTPVSSEQVVGTLNGGYEIAMGGLAGGRINIAACANGLSQSAINLAVAYLKERRQFDRALIEFQGLQFMLADMKMALEASRMLTWRAAKYLETNPDATNYRLHPSIAKCFSTDAAMKITTDAVQLFGGSGYVKDFPVEKLMRDAKMLQIVEGTNQIQRNVIAREMTLES